MKPKRMIKKDIKGQKTNEEVIEQYSTLVKRIAHHLLARLPPSVYADDLIQAGMIGLLEAYKNFDVNKGASFETYAGIRIRGSMLDEIRKGDWAPRSVHRNTRRMAQAIRELENQIGRDAKDCEIANYLEVTLDQYHQMLQDTNGTRLFGFDDLGVNIEALSESLNSPNVPLDKLTKDNFKEILAEGISGLPERERLVLALYYDEELNLKEIGAVLGVSESRICQIHTQSMLRLQSRLKEWKFLST
ncbi:MAG: DNA-directed polymerase [Francisellaceae bacterium]|nr:DNA-directed polymerase [Francisellaceae bacterium]